MRCNVTQTHPDWFQAPVTTQDNFSGIILCVPLAAANAARRCYVISRLGVRMETHRNTKLAVAALLLFGPAPASLYRVEDVDSR